MSQRFRPVKNMLEMRGADCDLWLLQVCFAGTKGWNSTGLRMSPPNHHPSLFGSTREIHERGSLGKQHRFGDCSCQKQAELHNHLKQRQSDLFSSGQTSELRKHTGIYNSLRSDWLIAFAVAVVSSPVTHLSPVPLIFSCTSTAKYPLPIQHHVLHAEICQQVWNGFAWIQDQSRLRSRDLCLFCSS